MQDTVIIKSSHGGLHLILDPESDFETLIRAICQKFHDNRKFFGSASMAITVEGIDFSKEELGVITEAIELNSDVKVKSIDILQKKKEEETRKTSSLIEDERPRPIGDHAKIIFGSIRDEEVHVFDESVIILGDVRSRASIQSAGHIIVLGRLEGNAHAGFPDRDDCFIIANEMVQEHLTIGNHSGHVELAPKWERRVRRGNIHPMSVAVFHDQLLMEPTSSGMIHSIVKTAMKE